MKTIISSFALVALAGVNLAAAPLHFQSGMKQVPLLELYTSEGCSSCPPAETWLNRLKGSPALWQDFVPVAFHVDYWDALGWPDRWAAPEFSERQRNYAQLWHAENIYTPCYALNGVEWHGWQLRSSLPAAATDDVGILAVSSQNTNLWNVTFVPVKPLVGNVEIHAALLAGNLDSDVLTGENKGRRLHHEFAVLDLVQIGLANRHGTARGKFIVAAQRHAGEPALALAVWLTHSGEETPLQATGGWLRLPVAPGK